MGDGGMKDDKWEESGKEIMEQQARMAIRDRTTTQDVLIRNYIYISCFRIYVEGFPYLLEKFTCDRQESHETLQTDI